MPTWTKLFFLLTPILVKPTSIAALTNLNVASPPTLAISTALPYACSPGAFFFASIG